MADRVTLVRGTATVRVVAGDVDRFKAMGYSEPAPAHKPVASKRRSTKAGDS